MDSVECKRFAYSLKLAVLGQFIYELKITKQWFEPDFPSHVITELLSKEAYGEHWYRCP